LVKAAQNDGYKVTLLFIWIDSPATAMQRVAERVVKGGHDIPSGVIERAEWLMRDILLDP